MLDNRKIRLMTKLAQFEEKDGKEDIKLGKYYKTDYVKFQVLKTFFAVTAGFFIIVLMLIFYNLDYFVAHAITLDYNKIIREILINYIAVAGIYVIGAVIGYSIKFSSSRKKLRTYYKNLKKLEKIYREDDGMQQEEGLK